MLILMQVILAIIGGIANVVIASNSAVYDQRQSGKTNVRVDLKDTVIIAASNGDFGGDYDYNYDYSDFTIRPPQQSTTTKAPSTTTKTSTTAKTTTTTTTSTTRTTSKSKTSSTSKSSKKTSSQQNYNFSQSTIYLDPQNNTVYFPPLYPSPNPLVQVPIEQIQDQVPLVPVPELYRNPPYNYLPVESYQNFPSGHFRRSTNSVKSDALPKRNCSPGFFLDGHNRCKRIVGKSFRENPPLP